MCNEAPIKTLSVLVLETQSMWNHFKLFLANNYLGHRAGLNSSPTPGWFLDRRLGILRRNCSLFSSQPRSKLRIGLSSSMELSSSCSPTEDSWSHREIPKCAQCCSSRLGLQLLSYQKWNCFIYAPPLFFSVLAFSLNF